MAAHYLLPRSTDPRHRWRWHAAAGNTPAAVEIPFFDLRMAIRHFGMDPERPWIPIQREGHNSRVLLLVDDPAQATTPFRSLPGGVEVRLPNHVIFMPDRFRLDGNSWAALTVIHVDGEIPQTLKDFLLNLSSLANKPVVYVGRGAPFYRPHPGTLHVQEQPEHVGNLHEFMYNELKMLAPIENAPAQLQRFSLMDRPLLATFQGGLYLYAYPHAVDQRLTFLHRALPPLLNEVEAGLGTRFQTSIQQLHLQPVVRFLQQSLEGTMADIPGQIATLNQEIANLTREINRLTDKRHALINTQLAHLENRQTDFLSQLQTLQAHPLVDRIEMVQNTSFQLLLKPYCFTQGTTTWEVAGTTLRISSSRQNFQVALLNSRIATFCHPAFSSASGQNIQFYEGALQDQFVTQIGTHNLEGALKLCLDVLAGIQAAGNTTPTPLFSRGIPGVVRQITDTETPNA